MTGTQEKVFGKEKQLALLFVNCYKFKDEQKHINITCKFV